MAEVTTWLASRFPQTLFEPKTRNALRRINTVAPAAEAVSQPEQTDAAQRGEGDCTSIPFATAPLLQNRAPRVQGKFVDARRAPRSRRADPVSSHDLTAPSLGPHPRTLLPISSLASS